MTHANTCPRKPQNIYNYTCQYVHTDSDTGSVQISRNMQSTFSKKKKKKNRWLALCIVTYAQRFEEFQWMVSVIAPLQVILHKCVNMNSVPVQGALHSINAIRK